MFVLMHLRIAEKIYDDWYSVYTNSKCLELGVMVKLFSPNYCFKKDENYIVIATIVENGKIYDNISTLAKYHDRYGWSWYPDEMEFFKNIILKENDIISLIDDIPFRLPQ